MCVAFALVISSSATFGADNLTHGTWKQNLSKSKFTPGPAPTSPATLRIEAAPGGEVITVDSVDAGGKSFSYSYKALYDGTPQKVSGSPYGDTVTLKQINSTSDRDQLHEGRESVSNVYTDGSEGWQDNDHTG